MSVFLFLKNVYGDYGRRFNRFRPEFINEIDSLLGPELFELIPKWEVLKQLISLILQLFCF